MERLLCATLFPTRARCDVSLRCALLLLCIALFGISPASAAQFSTSLDRDTVVLGEEVALALRFEGGVQGNPSLPQIPGVQVKGLSRGFQSSPDADGKMASTVTFTYTLVPTQIGDITIPALQIDVGGQRLSSQPLTLHVLREDASAPPATMGNQIAFLWPVWPKKEVYLHEPIVLEMRLYVHTSVRRIGEFQAPLNGDGFTAGKYTSSQGFQRMVGSTPYSVVPFRVAITPIKTGVLTIEPVKGSVILNPADVFEGFFNRARPQQAQLALDKQEIKVLPLPTDKVPPGFSGAVGKYEMNVSVAPTNVAAGDPITVKVQIRGHGALDSITLPEQDWKGFKIYPAAPQAPDITDAFGLDGSKSFEQVISPDSTEVKEVPPFTFSYFDPDAKTYRTLTHLATKLVVRPGGAVSIPVVAAGKNRDQDKPHVQQDIVPLKQRLGAVAQIRPPLLQQPWFLALQALPLLAWLGAWGWRNRTDALAKNPRLRRQRQVAQLVRDGMKDLQRLAAENNSDEFFATMFRLLQEQLGERLDCPASAITEAVIEEKLRPRGAGEGMLNELRELFQMCNLVRYAPIKSSQELAAIVPRFEKVIRELQELKA